MMKLWSEHEPLDLLNVLEGMMYRQKLINLIKSHKSYLYTYKRDKNLMN